MSNLYCSVESQTNRGPSTKTKTGKTWMRSHTRTWKHGVTVHYYLENNVMHYEVCITGGSNDPATKRVIATGVINDWK